VNEEFTPEVGAEEEVAGAIESFGGGLVVTGAGEEMGGCGTGGTTFVSTAGAGTAAGVGGCGTIGARAPMGGGGYRLPTEELAPPYGGETYATLPPTGGGGIPPPAMGGGGPILPEVGGGPIPAPLTRQPPKSMPGINPTPPLSKQCCVSACN